MKGVDYDFRSPNVAFEEFVSAAVGEGIPIRDFLDSPVARVLFLSGMSASAGTYRKLFADCRGHATALLAQLAERYYLEVVAATQVLYEEGIGYEINSDALGGTPSGGAGQSGPGHAEPDRNGANSVPRRGEAGGASDRTRGADAGRRVRGGRSDVSENAGHDRGGNGSRERPGETDADRYYRNIATGGLGEGEQTGNVVADYWMLAGRRILPPSELNGPLAQLCETAFYMGASFVAGQVHGTLELDDAECDELTRETFLILLNSAIAAMQTSGAMLIAQGDDSVEP